MIFSSIFLQAVTFLHVLHLDILKRQIDIETESKNKNCLMYGYNVGAIPIYTVLPTVQCDTVHCKNLRVALTLLWVMSVACSGASIGPSVMGAAIYLYLDLATRISCYLSEWFLYYGNRISCYLSEWFLYYMATKFLLFIRTVPLLWPQNFLLFII